MKAMTATGADGMTTVGIADGNTTITRTMTDLPLRALDSV
jgi:hypothetical protein